MVSKRDIEVRYFTFVKICSMKKIKYRLVYNRRKLLNSQGTALVQLEASLGKDKIYFSTRVYVRPEEWDKRTSSVVNHPHASDLNAWLYEQVVRLEGLELSMWKKGVVPTLSQMKNTIESNGSIHITFQSFCAAVVKSSGRRKSTQYNLLGTLTLLEKFRLGFTWEDLNRNFLLDLECWLRGKGYAVNTIGKHLRNLRTFIHEAIAAGHLSSDDNPFRQYVIKQERSPHRYLKPDELEALEKLRLGGSLAHVRDVFLFCSYTGLRFSDFKQLDSNHFVNRSGKTWLVVQTRKTGSLVQIPLYLIFEGKALEVLARYPSVEDFTRIGSNTSVNRRLEKLRGLLGIQTHITFHVARHTCATLLCHYGVPITTVQKILGHQDLSTTQIYSEVMADTIVRDLSKVKVR